jgi:hypothetical protein
MFFNMVTPLVAPQRATKESIIARGSVFRKGARVASSSRAFQDVFEFLDAHGWRFPVQHRMTVGTNWSEVIDRINLVFCADSGEITEVVDMNVALAEIAIDLTETESANDALGPVVGDARSSCSGVALIGVHPDLMGGTLHEPTWVHHFAGKLNGGETKFLQVIQPNAFELQFFIWWDRDACLYPLPANGWYSILKDIDTQHVSGGDQMMKLNVRRIGFSI